MRILISLGRVILGVESSSYVICNSSFLVVKVYATRFIPLNLISRGWSLNIAASCEQSIMFKSYFLFSLIISGLKKKPNWTKKGQFYAGRVKNSTRSPGSFCWFESGHFSKEGELVCLALTRNDRGMLPLWSWTPTWKWQTITGAAFKSPLQICKLEFN